jgi:hypothetical protein
LHVNVLRYLRYSFTIIQITKVLDYDGTDD